MDISEKENEREGQGDQPAEGLPEEAWTWGKHSSIYFSSAEQMKFPPKTWIGKFH